MFSSFLSQIVWVFYISVHVCEQKKSEFLPTWMFFVLFFLPNFSCESFSRAVRDSGKGICLSIRGAPCFFRKLFFQCLCREGTSCEMGWPRGCMASALTALCSSRAAWHWLRSCENPFEHALRFSSLNSAQFLHLSLCASHFLFVNVHLAFKSE